jgi:hypothetical protein
MTDTFPEDRSVDEMDDELLAFHEAGHAVAMWRLGFGISVVSVGRWKRNPWRRPRRLDSEVIEFPRNGRR